MDEEAQYLIPSQQWSWMRLGAVGIQLTANLLKEVGSALDCVSTLVVQHTIFRDDQREFHSEAALELESLISGEWTLEDEFEDEALELTAGDDDLGPESV